MATETLTTNSQSCSGKNFKKQDVYDQNSYGRGKGVTVKDA